METLTFQIEYTDIKTNNYAELWAAEPFQCKPWWADYTLQAERKGDERGIGCQYKLDVVRACWAGWEGTPPGNRKLWIVQAADESLLDKTPPAPPLRPVRRGVNILRWVELPDPSPQPPPLPGEGEGPTPQPPPGEGEEPTPQPPPGEGEGPTPQPPPGEPEPEPQPDLPPIDPGPEPGHPPITPDPVTLPMVTTLVGNSLTSITRVHFWGTPETPGREIIFELPQAEYLRIFGEAGLVNVLSWLREQIEAGQYQVGGWHVRQ